MAAQGRKVEESSHAVGMGQRQVGQRSLGNSKMIRQWAAQAI